MKEGEEKLRYRGRDVREEKVQRQRCQTEGVQENKRNLKKKRQRPYRDR